MLISFENVTFGYSGVPIIFGATFALHEGERVGFVGENGAGKTTLLRLLTGELSPSEGEIFQKNGIRVGYLEQSGGFSSSSTVYGAMREVFAEDEALLSALHDTQISLSQAKESEYAALSARLESLQKRIAARDSYTYEVRIKTVLGGMGFSGVLTQKVDTMSGGERTKLKLCRLLLETPDLLVLDEPTNHLDLKTLFWLEEYLTSYKGAILVVSHDRYFLDRLTSRTLELEDGRLFSYKGNYSRYKVLKAERVEVERRAYEKQQEEIAKLKDYVSRNIVRATTAKSALSRVNKLERMDVLERPKPPKSAPRFAFSYDTLPYERVLATAPFDLTADGKILLKNAKITVMRGEKIALVGDNGTGKSTLVKFLTSGDGRITLGRYVKVAYYDQENADLDVRARVLDAFWERCPSLSQTDARAVLARAGLGAEDIAKTVGELSGGMRAKLEVAILGTQNANFLVLDEPTNHLDLAAREALEDALEAFDGTLLFVSHDRRFIERLAKKIFAIENCEIKVFEGGYGEYLAAKREPVPEKSAEKPKNEGYRSRQERAKETQKRTRIREIEERIAAIEAEEEALSLRLAEVAADYGAVKEVQAALTALAAESDALYAEYETLI